jgi:hypothetical protein
MKDKEKELAIVLPDTDPNSPNSGENGKPPPTWQPNGKVTQP